MFQHIKIIITQGDGCPKYPDFIISHSLHVTKYHMHPLKYVQLLHFNNSNKNFKYQCINHRDVAR